MTTAQTDRRPGGDGRTPGRPGPHDFLNLDAHLSDEERGIKDEIRSFVEERIRPNIKDWFERAHFPRELVPEMGSLGLLGMHLKGYGCAGKSAVAFLAPLLAPCALVVPDYRPAGSLHPGLPGPDAGGVVVPLHLPEGYVGRLAHAEQFSWLAASRATARRRGVNAPSDRGLGCVKIHLPHGE